jgi:hypothetical protein
VSMVSLWDQMIICCRWMAYSPKNICSKAFSDLEEIFLPSKCLPDV